MRAIRHALILPPLATIIVLGISILLTPAAFPQISSFTLDSKPKSVTFTFNPPKGSMVPVTGGAPYSADQIIENVKTLADGTHVSEPRNARHIVRDSQGRTRIERPLLETHGPNGWTITVAEIRHPVGGFYSILDPQTKVAHRFATPQRSPQPQETQPPAALPSHAPKTASEPETSGEDLGSQWIEGVIANGYRVTTTWPIGTQGNDRPIVSVHESWLSPDLKTEVRTLSSDPRTGDTTFKLTNITRAEPDPALLQLPQDYTIVDEKGRFTITVTRD